MAQAAGGLPSLVATDAPDRLAALSDVQRKNVKADMDALVRAVDAALQALASDFLRDTWGALEAAARLQAAARAEADALAARNEHARLRKQQEEDDARQARALAAEDVSAAALAASGRVSAGSDDPGEWDTVEAKAAGKGGAAFNAPAGDVPRGQARRGRGGGPAGSTSGRGAGVQRGKAEVGGDGGGKPKGGGCSHWPWQAKLD